jgi:hypothetical protein
VVLAMLAAGSLRERASIGTIVASLLLAGCGGGQGSPARDAQVELGAGERQDPRAAVCASAEAAGETAAPPFDVIQAIFEDNCTSCHSHGADLDLSPGLAWTNLVGVPAPVTESCGGTLVVAGDPAASYLLQKISSDHPCSGMRMPRTEFAPDPLPDCVIALVRNWIAAGAPGVAGTDGGGD